MQRTPKLVRLLRKLDPDNEGIEAFITGSPSMGGFPGILLIKDTEIEFFHHHGDVRMAILGDSSQCIFANYYHPSQLEVTSRKPLELKVVGPDLIGLTAFWSGDLYRSAMELLTKVQRPGLEPG